MSDFLTNMLKQQSHTDSERQEAKRMRSEGSFTPITVDIGRSLAESLFNIHKIASNSPELAAKNSSLEVEARFGMILRGERRWFGERGNSAGRCVVVDEGTRSSTGLEFKSGVDEYIVEKIKKALVCKGTVLPVQHLRFNEANKTRWEIQNNVACPTYEKKVRLSRCDCALISNYYDVRVGAYIEKIVEMNESPIDTSQYSFERIKYRTTYIPNAETSHVFKDGSYWCVDITRVECIDRLKPDVIEVETEVEVELVRSARDAFVAANTVERITELCNKYAFQLLNLINLFIPRYGDDISGDTSAVLSSISEVSADYIHYKREIMRLNGLLAEGYGQQINKFEFLGSMPVNLVRRNLSAVTSLPYCITEKTDGVRYLLFTIASKDDGRVVAIAMDRSLKLFSVSVSPELLMEVGSGCVFDGEIVFNKLYKKKIFLIFDVIFIKDKLIAKFPFKDRLSKLKTEILPMLQRIQSNSLQNGGVPLVLKQFFQKSQIGVLLSKFQLENGSEHIYVNQESGLIHKSDGIVFVPAEKSYVLRTDPYLLKWKWTELCSVDLLVKLNGMGAYTMANRSGSGTVHLFAGGPDDVLVECTQKINVSEGAIRTNINRYDQYRLIADVEDASVHSEHSKCIAEVVYSSSSGMWEYKQLRGDKTYPNAIATVMSVLMELADGICIEELEYVLLARSAAENDYLRQIVKMKQSALAFQRDRVRKPPA